MEVLRKTAEFRLNKQTEGLSVDEVSHISLSGVPLMPELLAKYPNLTHLTLVAMKPAIKSLTELPLASLAKLRFLTLSDNAISLQEVCGPTAAGSELPTLPILAGVRRLLLANNKIATMDEVAALAAAFPSLELLDLDDNLIDVKEPSSFAAVYDLFPNLVSLNGQDKERNEVYLGDSDEEEEDEEDEDDEDDEEGSTSEGSSTDEDGGDDASRSDGSKEGETGSDEEEEDDSNAPEKKRSRK